MAPQKRSNLVQFALIFAVVYLGSQVAMRYFFPQQFGGTPTEQGIQLKAASATVTYGNHPVLTLQNGTNQAVVIPNRCPQPPVDIQYVENAGTPTEKKTPVTQSGSAAGCVVIPPVAAHGKGQISLQPWKFAYFSRLGTYDLTLHVQASGSGAALVRSGSGAQTASGAVAGPQTLTTRITMVEPGPFTKLFRTFILKPFLNALIFIGGLLPGHNLGLAVLLLTIITKLVLFIPTQHAMEGQKKMQLLQPKLEALKKKYPDDAKKVQEETMKLWKEHNVNPFQTCLPTLVQFPVLIGLYYAVREGAALQSAQHLIYPVYQNLPWQFGTHFLGLDLLVPNVIVMPVLLVVLQFLQMKLAFAIQGRKKAAQKKDIIDVPVKDGAVDPVASQNMQQNIMQYGLPLMIGFFALQFPAAVSLYWGISTLFGIGQQMIVNREHLKA